MADPTPSLRDQGRQALQAGNLDAAVDLLSRAVMASDADTDAKMMLGIAYSMKGLHAQAKRALEGAVAGAPQNADYRFNLGMVLEKGGDTQGAAQAFRETLQINPQHPQARAKLQALGPQAGYAAPAAPLAAPPPPAATPPPSAPVEPPSSSTYGAPPTWGPSPGSPPAPPPPQAPPVYGQPPAGGGLPGMPPPPVGLPPVGAAPLGGLPPLGHPPVGSAPMGGQPPIGQPGMAPPPPIGAALPGMPPLGAPMGGPPMGGPPIGAIPGMGAPPAPDGMVQCPRCGQFTRPGMLCEMCSTPLPPPARQVAPTGPAAFGTIGPTPEYKPAPAPRVGFKDGFAQWWEVLTGPRAFFEEQADRDGLNEPSTFIMVWCVVVAVVITIADAVVLHDFRIHGVFCTAVMMWLVVMAFMHIWAVSIHGLSRLFGGQGTYSGSFRVAAYSSAPSLLALVFFFVALTTLPKSAGMATAFPHANGPRPRMEAGLAQFGAPPQPGMPRYGSPQFGVPPQPGQPPQFGTPGQPGFRPGGGFSNGLPGGNRPGLSPEQVAQILGSLGWAFAILMLGSIWSTILAGIGIAHVHGVGTGQAVFAVILASLLYNLLVGLIVGLVAATLGVAIMGFAQMISGGRH